MLTSIEYTTWRRLVRPRGSPPNAPPDPVWVQRGTQIRAVCPVILQEFIEIVQQQPPVHDRGLDYANL
jgi:hypothetical protein